MAKWIFYNLTQIQANEINCLFIFIYIYIFTMLFISPHLTSTTTTMTMNRAEKSIAHFEDR
jgi:hypothetical protein